MTHNARRCTARRKDGLPCRAWATRDSDPPRCATHRQRAAPQEDEADFYERAYYLKQAADQLSKAEKKGLKDELRATRMEVLRVLEQLQEEMEPAEYARTIGLFFKGMQTITDIMRAQRTISGREKEILPQWVDKAIRELEEERDQALRAENEGGEG